MYEDYKEDSIAEGTGCCLISGFVFMSIGVGLEYGSGYGFFVFGLGMFLFGMLAMYLERKNAKRKLQNSRKTDTTTGRPD